MPRAGSDREQSTPHEAPWSTALPDGARDTYAGRVEGHPARAGVAPIVTPDAAEKQAETALHKAERWQQSCHA